MFGIPSNVLIAVAGVLALVLMNTNSLSYVKSLLSKKSQSLETVKQEKNTLDEAVVPVTTPITQRDPEIYEIVEQWDVLKRMCQRAGLQESVKSLDSVFLNLLKRVELNGKDAS